MSLSIEHIPQVLTRIATGEYPAHVAQSLGISKQALQQRLRDNPEYLTARQEGWESRLDNQIELIEQAAASLNNAEGQEAARQALDLVRAREALLKRLEWRAEREFPHRWGQRTHVTVDLTVELGDRLRRARERVIDGQVIDSITESNASPSLTDET